MEEKGDKHAGGAQTRFLVFAATTIVALLAMVVGHALLRGPLTTESLARALFVRVPRALAVVLAVGLASPGLWVVFRAPASWLDRAFASAVALFGALLVVGMDRAGPRRVFDTWERAFTTTALGVPWIALVALVLAALVALAAGRALAAWLVARGAPMSPRLAVQTWLLALALFAVPAAATIYLTTGTRLLPGIEADETWAPAFADAPCPPREGAPASARATSASSAAAATGASSAPSAPSASASAKP